MIKSETFGGVVLSGVDAQKFANQVRYGRPTRAATDTLRRGDELLQAFRERTGVDAERRATGESLGGKTEL